MNKKIALAALAAAFAAAGAAEAQEFNPKATGSVVLNVRVTDVAPQGTPAALAADDLDQGALQP